MENNTVAFHQVIFRGRAAIADGAAATNGVLFRLLYWDGERWVNLAGRTVGFHDGTVTLTADISHLYGRQCTFILGAGTNGNSAWDWAHWVEAVIEIDGQLGFDFIEAAPAAYWHSRQGSLNWGSSGSAGTATYAYNVRTSDGLEFARTLYVHPDFTADGYSHGAYDVELVSEGDEDSDCLATVAPDHWTGEYFNNPTLSGAPSAVRDDGGGFLDFNWGTGSPAGGCGLGTDLFSVRWSREVYFEEGTYRFTITSDDGFRLYVDDSAVLEHWVDQAPTTYTAEVALNEGYHEILLEYYDKAWTAVAGLSWEMVSSGLPPQVIFRGRAAIADGAAATNGVLFRLLNWDGERWVNLTGRTVGFHDGTVTLTADISHLYGRQCTFILGAGTNGNSAWDWAHWVEAVIEIDGQPVFDFIEAAPSAHWHSRQGSINWGSSGSAGTAAYAYNVRASDGLEFARTLYVHPDFSADGYSHGAYAVELVAGGDDEPDCLGTVAPDHWTGEYFNNPTLSGAPVVVRDDGDGFLDFNWGTGSPASGCGLDTDLFSARWNKEVFFEEGTYRFTITSDDGFRLYVDDSALLDRWVDQPPTTYTAEVELSEGYHEIRLEYYENGGGAQVQMSWTEIDDGGFLSEWEIPVLVIKYFPVKDGRIDKSVTGDVDMPLDQARQKTDENTLGIIDAMESGTRYRYYNDPSATSSLTYRIVEVIEYLEPMPTWNKAGHSHPMTDYNAIMNRVDGRYYVEELGVKEVWLWGYHGGVVDIWESNMAGPFGDISNSDRDPGDLPVYSRTYTFYHYNYSRGVSEAVEDHIHQQEAVFRHLDSDLFWSKFVGRPEEHRCGWAHYPPNAVRDYDWANTIYVWTDIEDWRPDGSGSKIYINCSRWNCDSLEWFVYWMQSVPGKGNLLYDGDRKLANWWSFIGDYDNQMAAGRSLADVE